MTKFDTNIKIVLGDIMNAKEKKISNKSNKGNLIIASIIIIWVAVIAIYYLNGNKQVSYAYSADTANASIEISNANQINIEEIIYENAKDYTQEEITTEEVELEYITKYKNNDQLAKGTTQVVQEGRNGTQQIITKKIYDEQGQLISEEQLSATVVKASIDKIIEIGTAEQNSTSNSSTNQSSNNSSGLSFDMNLNQPSGFSLEQFKTALTDSKDVNKIFQNNAEYFYLIEEEYNINGMFVAALGIHESGWGTSKLALNKFNLFGYGAYDSNPYNGAYEFSSYAESIDLIARVFVKYYINPKGTAIYDGQTASGKYYSGSTLSDVNKKYASDTNWANSIYSYMQYLYNKL